MKKIFAMIVAIAILPAANAAETFITLHNNTPLKVKLFYAADKADELYAAPGWVIRNTVPADKYVVTKIVYGKNETPVADCAPLKLNQPYAGVEVFLDWGDHDVTCWARVTPIKK